jgi:hypothetical protein
MMRIKMVKGIKIIAAVMNKHPRRRNKAGKIFITIAG